MGKEITNENPGQSMCSLVWELEDSSRAMDEAGYWCQPFYHPAHLANNIQKWLSKHLLEFWEKEIWVLYGFPNSLNCNPLDYFM